MEAGWQHTVGFEELVRLMVDADMAALAARKAGVLEPVFMTALFWLDGHYSGGETAKGDADSPLREELEAIGRHPIKTHVIPIDDVRSF